MPSILHTPFISSNKCSRKGFFPTSLKESLGVFESMTERSLVTWNAMLAVCSNCGQLKETMRVFEGMQLEEVVPDKIVGHDEDLTVGNSLISMYGKCGSSEDAEVVFESMAIRDVVTWSAIITAFSEQGMMDKAFWCHEQMLVEGTNHNEVTMIVMLGVCSNKQASVHGKHLHVVILELKLQQHSTMQYALMQMYGKCGNIQEAERIFFESSTRDLALWNLLIQLYCDVGRPQESLQLFDKMGLGGVVPDKVTVVSALTACADMVAFSAGELIHQQIIDGNHDMDHDITVTNTLTSMYGKCGNMKKAQRMFHGCQHRTVITYSVMIEAYALQGCGREAIELMKQMVEARVTPNSVTFINLLVACSHAGLVMEGLGCVASMQEDYGILPCIEHYASLVDLLARAGNLDDAECLINICSSQAQGTLLMILLRACRYQGDVERGERAAICIAQLQPGNFELSLPLWILHRVAAMDDVQV